NCNRPLAPNVQLIPGPDYYTLNMDLVPNIIVTEDLHTVASGRAGEIRCTRVRLTVTSNDSAASFPRIFHERAAYSAAQNGHVFTVLPRANEATFGVAEGSISNLLFRYRHPFQGSDRNPRMAVNATAPNGITDMTVRLVTLDGTHFQSLIPAP